MNDSSLNLHYNVQSIYEMGCPRIGMKIAIVVPFVIGNIPSLVSQLNRWKHPNFAPCINKVKEPMVDIIYYTDKNYESMLDHLKPLQEKLESLQDVFRNCIGKIEFLSSNLSEHILNSPKMVSVSHQFF